MIVVVGGGVAGLVLARDLAAAGRPVTVLERGDRLGGTVAGLDLRLDDGTVLRVDAGADSFATRGPAVADLAAELGLDVVLPRPAGAWVRLPDRTVPLPRAGLLGVPGDVWSADVRAAIGVTGALRASLDRVLPGTHGLADDASLGAVVRRRLGRRVLDRLVAPVVTGVHSTPPDALRLDAVLPGAAARLRAAGRRPASLADAVRDLRAAAPAGSAVAGIAGGMHRLVEALAADVRARGVVVRLGAEVADVVPAAPGPGGEGPGGIAVLLASGERLPADAVVLTHTLPALTGPPSPTADVVLATLVVDAPALDAAPRGTGVLVAAGAPTRAKALTHATAKWAWLAAAAGPGRHVLRLSYDAAVAPADDDALTRLAVADAADLLGAPVPRVLASARTAWSPPRPDAARAAAVRAALPPAVRAAGAWVAGTGLLAVVADARATARAVLADLPGDALGNAPENGASAGGNVI